jgi:cytochrome P450
MVNPSHPYNVYRIWSGTTPEVILTKAEDIKQMFRDSNMHLKAKNNDAGWLMGELLGKCLGLVSGQQWQSIRSATSPSLAKGEIVEHILHIQRLTEEYFEGLHRHGTLDKGVINPVADLQMLPFWIVADHLYGALDLRLRTELKSLIPIREALFVRVFQGGATRFWCSKFLPTKTNRDLSTFKERWHSFNNTAVQKARSSPPPQAPVVVMYEAMEEGFISAENLYQP